MLADALTNEDFSSFDPARRLHVSVDEATLPTMFKMLKHGRDLYAQVEEAKAANKGIQRIWPKTPNSKRLKVTHPW